MTSFVAILLLFLASHSIPARPRLRARLVAALGERLYLTLYALTSIVLLACLIGAAQRSPYIPLWPPSLTQYWAPILLMPLALFLLIGGVLVPNPFSVGFRGERFDPAKPGIVGITRHPLLWGFALWGLSHMVPNGDLVSIVMFSGFALFAIGAMPMLDRRKKRQLGSKWTELTRNAPAIPFAAVGKRKMVWAWPRGLLLLTICMTALSYAALLQVHAQLFGPDPTIAVRAILTPPSMRF